MLSHQSGDIDVSSFEKASGIGVTVTPDEIEKVVEEVISEHKEGLIKERYRYNVGKILGMCRAFNFALYNLLRRLS